MDIKLGRTKTTTTSFEFGVSDELLKNLFSRLLQPTPKVGWASTVAAIIMCAISFAYAWHASIQFKQKIEVRIHNAITLHELRR